MYTYMIGGDDTDCSKHNYVFYARVIVYMYSLVVFYEIYFSQFYLIENQLLAGNFKIIMKMSVIF